MKALLLVGGFGTRLRPLTFEVPKPMVPFANKPIIEHQIEALVKVGVKEIIMAVGFKSDCLKDYLEVLGKKLGVKIIFSQETVPMGTAGPLKLAEEHLTSDNEEGMFFVFNSDVIWDFPLEKLIEFHKKNKAEGTILLTKVEEPSKYGVVLSNEEGCVQRFVEKPKEYVGNRINAGIYLLNKEIINRIENKPTSIEREIFPLIAEEKKLYWMDLESFWMDIGQPKDFLTGLGLYLGHLQNIKSNLLTTGDNIIGNVLIDPEAHVDPTSKIGPNVAIGKGCVIGSGVRIQNATIMEHTTIESNSWVWSSIIGKCSKVGKWVRIEGLTVIADDCQISDELFINAAMILPHKEIKASLMEKGQIIL